MEPRSYDRAKVYLYLKEWASRLFEFKGARNGDDVVRAMLLAYQRLH